MTVGEKIQSCRKELGMSQEELGQKLLVSRQTISLWEKGQTVPTLDNLIRLKETLGISLDKLFDDMNAETAETPARETYRFRFSKRDWNEIQKAQGSALYKRTVWFTLLLLILIVFRLASSAPDPFFGFLIGALALSLVQFGKAIYRYRQSWKRGLDKKLASEYVYEVFDDHLQIRIFRNDDLVHLVKYGFDEIGQMQPAGNYIFFSFGGPMYVVRKSALQENSFFYSYMYHHPLPSGMRAVYGPKKTVSNVLFAASLLSVIAAALLSFAVSADNPLLFGENLWLFFLFTPFPVASVAWGFYLKSKGYAYKKNVAVGIIMTILLCLYGAAAFAF